MGECKFGNNKIKRVFEDKLDVDFRTRRENVGWVRIDNIKEVKVSIPHGRKKPRVGLYNEMLKQWYLNEEEFCNLIRCPMSGDDYKNMVKRKKYDI